MSSILPIGEPVSAGGMSPSRKEKSGVTPAGEDPGRSAMPVDQVEISEMAQVLSTLDVNDEIRTDKVMAIREEIANGIYETEAKLEYTISRLLEILRPAR